MKAYQKGALLFASLVLNTAQAKAPDAGAASIKPEIPAVVAPSPGSTGNQPMQYHLQRLKLQSTTENTSGSTSGGGGGSQNQQYHQERLRLQSAETSGGGSQNQQYHQERLKLLKAENNGGNSQNQQYHQERLKLLQSAENSGGGSQNQQYHQERLKLLKAEGSMDYHIQMLRVLSGAKPTKTADARLDGYLRKYLTEVERKGDGEKAQAVVDFGGCVIASTYANQSVAQAQKTCGEAVEPVKLAGVESCVKGHTANPVRECVTSSIKSELSAVAQRAAPATVKFAEAAKTAPAVAK